MWAPELVEVEFDGFVVEFGEEGLEAGGGGGGEQIYGVPSRGSGGGGEGHG